MAHWHPAWLRGRGTAEARLSREDETTGLQLLPGVYPRIQRALHDEHPLGVLFLYLVDFETATKVIDWPSRQRFLAGFGRAIRELPGSLLRQEDVVSLGYGGGSDFMVFLAPPRDERGVLRDELSLVARRIEERLQTHLQRLTADWDLTQPVRLQVGYSTALAQPDLPAQVVVHQAIEEARARAKDQQWQATERLEHELVTIVRQRSVTTLFQPIISLVDGQVMAYEALSRGPAESFLFGADELFAAAETAGLLMPLERLCRETALRAAAPMPEPARLFINVSPEVIHDPSVVRDLVAMGDQMPNRVVVELTERHAIKDLQAFQEVLNKYRAEGLGFAIDDAGAGHSSLRAVAALRPDYIKIDMSLVRDIDRDRAKYALVSALATFARRIDAFLVAEGIETVAELNSLIEIGVPYGQGYLIARPQISFAAPSEQLVAAIKAQIELREKKMSGQAVFVQDVAKPATILAANTPCRVAEELFRTEPLLQAVVVVDHDTPVGLVSREKFFAKLGSQFGYSVFAARPLREGMNASALLVQTDESLELVSRKAVHRRSEDTYDHIIVVDGPRLCGVLSVIDLLDITTRRQVSLAKYSNPLSGLPGNVLIQQETERRLQADQEFVFCHVDLDRFKHYNDSYGFSAGDNVILLLGQAMQAAAGSSGDFVGHIGGDDFVLITTAARVEPACRAIVRQFRAGLQAATLNGGTQTPAQHDPGRMTVSMAAVTCVAGMSFDDVSLGASHSKKLAKGRRGDALVWDGTAVSLGGDAQLQPSAGAAA